MKKAVLTGMVGLLAASLVGFVVGVQVAPEAWAGEDCGACEEVQGSCYELIPYQGCHQTPCECELGGGRTGLWYKACPGVCSIEGCCDLCTGCDEWEMQCKEPF